MRHYSMYSTICKHWHEETSECALILLCVCAKFRSKAFYVCARLSSFFLFFSLQSMAQYVCFTHCRGSLDSNFKGQISFLCPQKLILVAKQTKDRFCVCFMSLDGTNKTLYNVSLNILMRSSKSIQDFSLLQQ